MQMDFCLYPAPCGFHVRWRRSRIFFFHTLPGVSRHAEKTGSLKVYIVAKKVTLSGDITNAE